MGKLTSAKSMMEAILLVLLDKRPKTDAMFIHGSSVTDPGLDDATLKLSRETLKRGDIGRIVINGVSESVCNEKNLAYFGCEPWLRTLAILGVERKDIVVLPESLHTAAESGNLITLALQSGWQSLTIFALPHHILRCMLQIVYLMEQRHVFLKVYARTLDSVDWNMDAEKTVLGGGFISGTMFNHIAAEYKRVEKYKRRDRVGFTPHATVGELIEYIHKRDGV
ncbi:MAG: hypothetical protein G01um101456_569 [Parcubacteria group bacterium Gr01-1014_56]|nr:MAG: hypothetical protein G01um101456_569 [Parcubacteria group bacterium Gr01-1014_56]